MAFPQRGVLYRLQPVAFDTFLELWDAEEDGVRLQTLKEIDLQQWLFVGDSELSGSQVSEGNNRFEQYYIVAAATNSEPFRRFLTVPSTTRGSSARPQALTEDDAEPSLWTLTKTRTNDDSYFLITEDSDASGASDVFLQVTMNGEISTVKKPKSNNLRKSRAVRWKIVDYYPSISLGTYKIKAAIDSNVLDITANLDSMFVAVCYWNVEPKGNGECYFSLKGYATKYLGCNEDESGFPRLAITITPFKWFVKHVNATEYSVTLNYVFNDLGRTKMALALHAISDKVFLSPSKNVRNQVWSFEDVSSSSTGSDEPGNEQPTSAQENTGNQEQPPNDKEKPAKDKAEVPPPYVNPYLNSRYPEIRDGIFNIRNLGTRDYISWTKHRQYVRSYWDAIQPTKTPGGNYLKYNGITNMFWLHHRIPNFDEYINTYARFHEGYVATCASEGDATTFVLEHVGDAFTNDRSFYICSSLDRSKVIPALTHSHPQYEGRIFTVATKTPNDQNQLWKFESA